MVAVNEAAETRLFYINERERDERWLWLLHDDAVPAPDALYQLLAHVVTDPEHRHHRPQAVAAAAAAGPPVS